MHFQWIARFSAKLAAALILVLGVASQASAATITATFAGTVKTGLDTTGVFGSPGADLAGAGYSLVYTVDPTVGAYSTYTGTIGNPLLNGDQIFKGISAVLTINSHTYAFAGTGTASGNFDLAGTKPGFGMVAYQFQNPTVFSQVNAFLSNNNPPGFPTSVFSAVAINDCPSGSCSFFGGFIIPISSVASFSGYFNFGSLTVTTTPVPAALPLLVSALGGLGFVGWRRREVAAA
jgi:hypothetical protein